MIIQTDWLLSAEELLHARNGGRLWRVRLEQGKRSTTCRECGGRIAAGDMRRHFRRVDVAIRTYDLQGYIHADRRICEENRTVDELTAWQKEQADELLAQAPEIVNVTVEELKAGDP